MGPSATRVAILIAELMIFFLVTAFASYFISHAGALRMAPGAAVPAYFPVIAYDGNRDKPDPKGYFVVPWADWEAASAKRTGASLLLPERSGNVRIGEDTKAAFTAEPEGDSRQSIELTWTGKDGEQHVVYSAQARAIEPRFFRAVTTNTILLSAAIGFVCGLMAGRVMRRRWLGFSAVPKT